MTPLSLLPRGWSSGIVAFILGLIFSMMFQDYIHRAYPFDDPQASREQCLPAVQGRCLIVQEGKNELLPDVTLEEALAVLRRDAKDPVYYHGRVAKTILEYIEHLENVRPANE